MSITSSEAPQTTGLSPLQEQFLKSFKSSWGLETLKPLIKNMKNFSEKFVYHASYQGPRLYEGQSFLQVIFSNLKYFIERAALYDVLIPILKSTDISILQNRTQGPSVLDRWFDCLNFYHNQSRNPINVGCMLRLGEILIKANLPLSLEKSGRGYLFYEYFISEAGAKELGFYNIYNCFNIAAKGRPRITEKSPKYLHGLANDSWETMIDQGIVHPKNKHGMTPLYVACWNMQVEVVREIIQYISEHYSKDELMLIIAEMLTITDENNLSSHSKPEEESDTDDTNDAGDSKAAKESNQNVANTTKRCERVESTLDLIARMISENETAQKNCLAQASDQKEKQENGLVNENANVLGESQLANRSNKKQKKATKRKEETSTSSSNKENASPTSNVTLIKNKNDLTAIEKNLKKLYAIRAIVMNALQPLIDYEMFTFCQYGIFENMNSPTNYTSFVHKPFGKTTGGNGLIKQAIDKASSSGAIRLASLRIIQECVFKRTMLFSALESYHSSPHALLAASLPGSYVQMTMFNIKFTLSNMDSKTERVALSTQRFLKPSALVNWANTRTIMRLKKDGTSERVHAPIPLIWPVNFVANKKTMPPEVMSYYNEESQTSGMLTEADRNKFPWYTRLKLVNGSFLNIQLPSAENLHVSHSSSMSLSENSQDAHKAQDVKTTKDKPTSFLPHFNATMHQASNSSNSATEVSLSQAIPSASNVNGGLSSSNTYEPSTKPSSMDLSS